MENKLVSGVIPDNPGGTDDSVNPRSQLLKGTRYPLGDRIGYIKLLDFMGGDEAIVDRARKCYRSQDKKSPEADSRLLKRLVGSKPLHGTTLRGTVMTFDVTLPLFCMRQWIRHLAGHDYAGFSECAWSLGTADIPVAGAFDEMSFRYVDAVDKELAYYVPHVDLRFGGNDELVAAWQEAIKRSIHRYEYFREMGVEKGLARTFLPQCVYTQMEWTVNLQAFLDWYNKRMTGGGAQWEIVRYAESAWSLVESYVAPQTCQAFRESKGLE